MSKQTYNNTPSYNIFIHFFLWSCSRRPIFIFLYSFSNADMSMLGSVMFLFPFLHNYAGENGFPCLNFGITLSLVAYELSYLLLPPGAISIII